MPRSTKSPSVHKHVPGMAVQIGRDEPCARATLKCNALRVFPALLLAVSFAIFTSCICAAEPPEVPRLIAQLGHANGVSSVTLTADGELLATGGPDSAARLWEVSTGRELR